MDCAERLSNSHYRSYYPLDCLPAVHNQSGPACVGSERASIGCFSWLLGLISSIERDGTATYESIAEFSKDTGEQHFLFGPEVVEYLGSVRHKAFTLLVKTRVREGLAVVQAITQQYVDALDSEQQLREWFVEQLHASTSVFSKYLAVAESVPTLWQRIRKMLSV